MAIHHAESGEVIDIGPLGTGLRETSTLTLVKTDELEVIRLIVPAGSAIDRHHVAGQIIVQCLEGEVVFSTEGTDRGMTAGKMIFLQGGTPHALRARKDSSLLVTILLKHKAETAEK